MNDLISLIFFYLLAGAITGTLSGLFGIGGGLILVPLLAYTFKVFHISEAHIMHMAIGTSLSIILISVSSSTYFHIKKRPFNWQIYIKIAVFTALGSITGALIANSFSKETLKLIFTIYVSLVSIKMIFFSNNSASEIKHTPNILYHIVGLIIGFKSSILGIGGGTISIPFLTWRGHKMVDSVALSAALGIPIAVFGSLTYIFLGIKNNINETYSLGYVFIPAFLSSAVTIPLFSKIGTKISHKTDQKKLKMVFGIMLLIIALRSVYKFIN